MSRIAHSETMQARMNAPSAIAMRIGANRNMRATDRDALRAGRFRRRHGRSLDEVRARRSAASRIARQRGTGQVGRCRPCPAPAGRPWLTARSSRRGVAAELATSFSQRLQEFDQIHFLLRVETELEMIVV